MRSPSSRSPRRRPSRAERPRAAPRRPPVGPLALLVALAAAASPAAADLPPPPGGDEAAAVAIAAGQLPLLTHALRRRGVDEGELAAVVGATRAAGLDPPELLRILQTIAAAPPGAETRGLGAWLARQLEGGARGLELRRALLGRLRGGAP